MQLRTSTLSSGGLIAMASAVAFGATAPVIARFGGARSPFATAGLLYAGACVVTLPWLMRSRSAGTRLTPKDLPRLLAIAIAGAALAPTLFAWGIARAGATAGALLLNTEAVFTVVLAWAFYREPIGRRMLIALLCMTLGGVVLTQAAAPTAGAVPWLGIVAIVLATLAWALDNTWTRALAQHDPAHVVAIKGACGAALTLGISTLIAEPWPDVDSSLALCACGATGYGLSLRLYLIAQRELGAARTASIFALAPFVGAALAVGLGEQAVSTSTLLSAPLFAAGIVLHLRERHAHRHSHEPIEHEHVHRHDDGHHAHEHLGGVAVAAAHVHRHRHERLEHDHEHGVDAAHDHHGRLRPR